VNALQVTDGIWWVGVLNPDLRVFDVVMTTEYGTTYNAYVVKGETETALIETAKDRFFDEYLTRVKEIVDLKTVKYLIMSHTEPDHSGSVAKILEEAPQITVVGSSVALTFLKQIANRDFKSRAVAHGDTIDLGGKTLRFIDAPFLHWPDSIYTYIPEDQLLFTCDSFGTHYSDERIFNDAIDFDFTREHKYYFDMIMGPFKPYILQALDKIEGLPIKMICTGHGPIIRTDVADYIKRYREWAQPPQKGEKPKVVIAFASAYGYTKEMGGSIMEGIAMMGDFDIGMYDLVDVPVDQVVAEIETAAAILVGSSTIVGDALPPLWELLTKLSPIVHGGKLAGAFGSYGWSGEAVPNMEARLRSLRMQVVPGIKINFKPSPAQLEQTFAWGVEFGRKLIEKLAPKSQTRWRCLVCGQVFQGEEPPRVCPACGVGQENFVRVSPEEDFVKDSNETFVILGGGIAALSAAEAIRKRNQSAAIKIYTQEPQLVYYRPVLAEQMIDEVPEDQLYVHPDDWYREQRIDVATGMTAAGINTGEQVVSLGDGTQVRYDKLILAIGARSNIPPIPGVEKTGVFALRSLEDANRIKEYRRGAGKAVIIGGGVLGLEAAWELISTGMEVAVVEAAPRIMPRQMDEAGSARLRELIEKSGIKLYLGVSTQEITGADRAQGVLISTGAELPCDLVILSTGVRPNTELAAEAGIAMQQGVVVDNAMRTSSAKVYACGDVAEFNGNNAGLWPVAIEMGRVAGANAAGDWVEYEQPKLSTMLVAFDREIFSVGDVNQPPEACRIVEINDPAEGSFKKYFMKDGVLVGAIIIAPKVSTAAPLKALGKGGKVKATKWKCRRCGYIHEGPEPPDECPVCGAPKSMFDPIM
jgi:flavorubredoxin/NADPH-dependent 2,4-dienoyl-CoA reductase/sulfur reductase-like enzyme/rubredoxin